MSYQLAQNKSSGCSMAKHRAFNMHESLYLSKDNHTTNLLSEIMIINQF